MTRRILSNLLMIIAVALPAAADLFSLDRCRGSRMPYPAPDSVAAVPDTLTPVMIYHVGRHGARYATSEKHFFTVEANLTAHQDALTPKGRRLLAITQQAIEASADKWGKLDSLGVAEQKGIAARMCDAFPQLVVGQSVTGISSYVGRCVASMDAFVGEVRRMQSGCGEVTTAEGKQFSPLVRFFTTDSAYVAWAKEKPYAAELSAFTVSTSPAPRVITEFMKPETALTYTPAEAIDLCGSIYYVVSSLGAMGSPDADEAMALLTPEDYNALWEIDNLRQYFSRTSTTVSTLPADAAAPLLQNMISSIDGFIDGTSPHPATVQLHFGHAETLMPLLSLMRLPGCYYLTHYFDTVKDHWQTFHVVPMAANLQVIVCRSRSGQYYVRLDLNEHAVSIGGSTYLPWEHYRAYLLSLIH